MGQFRLVGMVDEFMRYGGLKDARLFGDDAQLDIRLLCVDDRGGVEKILQPFARAHIADIEDALHRMNRVEYATAIQDLLGVNVDVDRVLPPDVTSDGFDNAAQVLRISPTYLDRYIAAARSVSM